MNFSLPRHSAWLWLLCIALLAVRISGAHWHLCYDGNEPPQAVHVWDGAIDDKTEPGHSDTNLNLVDTGLSKNTGQMIDMPALLFATALLCILVLPRRGDPPRPYAVPFFPPARYALSAPPRAPPR